MTPALELTKYVVSCIPAMSHNGSIFNYSFRKLFDESFIRDIASCFPSEERTYYAPTVSYMSGVVLPRKEFTVEYALGQGRRILRPGYLGPEQNEKLRLKSDGVAIGPHDGFAMAAAGCLLLVLTSRIDEEVCICAHAGRDSLIDPLLIKKGARSRAHFSIVDAMVEHAKKRFRSDPKDLILRSFFSLPWELYPHDWNDPRYGETNKLLFRRLYNVQIGNALRRNADGKLCLSLTDFVQIRAGQLDIGTIETDFFDLGENPDCAHTQHENPELRGAVRNLVLVRRL